MFIPQLDLMTVSQRKTACGGDRFYSSVAHSLKLSNVNVLGWVTVREDPAPWTCVRSSVTDSLYSRHRAEEDVKWIKSKVSQRKNVFAFRRFVTRHADSSHHSLTRNSSIWYGLCCFGWVKVESNSNQRSLNHALDHSLSKIPWSLARCEYCIQSAVSQRIKMYTN